MCMKWLAYHLSFHLNVFCISGEHTKPDSAACGQEDGEDGGADVSSGMSL